jgi:hypothetical protein
MSFLKLEKLSILYNNVNSFFEPTANRKAGGLSLSAALWRTKTKARQCFQG